MSIQESTLESSNYREKCSSDNSFEIVGTKILRYCYALAIADLFEYGARMYFQSHLQDGAAVQTQPLL